MPTKIFRVIAYDGPEDVDAPYDPKGAVDFQGPTTYVSRLNPDDPNRGDDTTDPSEAQSRFREAVENLGEHCPVALVSSVDGGVTWNKDEVAGNRQSPSPT